MTDTLKPIAFRVRDFRSIRDSGICHLSGDLITVLAGQNESGKSAILYALRDFDLEPGKPPATSEYLPDGVSNPSPAVSVLFQFKPMALTQRLIDEKVILPPSVLDALITLDSLWVTRDLSTGDFKLPPEVEDLWSTEVSKVPNQLSADNFAIRLRTYWPLFNLFDSFSDLLPREVEADAEQMPTSVRDFLRLSGTDIKTVRSLSEQSNPKTLDNYLDSRSATITGDFHTYWNQGTQGPVKVQLRVRAYRNPSGALLLAFYVQDQGYQFPEQRSKGFQWFLSFYLRMTALAGDPDSTNYLLLIDEPGSYLHARAQRDILNLFEQRIALENHVMYTTHSPYLLPPDKLHRIRLVVRNGTTGTRVFDRLTHPELRGDQLRDTLSPILTAVGIDVSEALRFVKPLNVLVEGITDYMYLMRWMKTYAPDLVAETNVFPVMGGATMPQFAALFLGWGFTFAAVLDNDREGRQARKRLERDLALDPDVIVHPRDGLVTVEDHFSPQDFKSLLTLLDPTLSLEEEELPSSSLKRQASVDKVLLARRFSEVHPNGLTLNKVTEKSVKQLLSSIREALKKAGAEKG